MSVFFRTTMHHETQADGASYLGAIFFGVVIVIFNGYAELSMTIFRLPVFYKQRDLLFYPAWAYALPSFVLSIPSSIAEAGIYSLVTYYVIGYSPQASRYGHWPCPCVTRNIFWALQVSRLVVQRMIYSRKWILILGKFRINLSLIQGNIHTEVHQLYRGVVFDFHYICYCSVQSWYN